MTRRILTIMLAMVIAALGTAGVIYYALSADARARAAITDAVTVAIATERIPAGTTGARIRAEELVRLERMPRSSVPSTALPAVGAEFDKLVITSTINAGQVLLKANFGEQDQVTSGLALPEGKMAVTVQTGTPQQVAGYVRAGSQVAIFLTYKLVDKNGEESKIERTRLLLPRVQVMAVGSYTPPRRDTEDEEPARSGTANGTLLLTLAVDQKEAERLILGLNTGSLYLGLLTDSVTVKPGTGVENTDRAGGVSSIFP
ncbi:Flp pilus assembly protein CpaB [Micromonospora echinofusca]|uniref:Flp pilus assembly protein CpaB n=1 Tax=Micromonospora echinofusca TaxID=47858 RepID=A0ABS3VP47_MICEH|nr:Flp pilus assembly protein CpaB [Micromonospora echinofusca]MBO4206233.1 Flp pilus assembly protein CpaB [Micromonospora echinofusca]